MLTLIDNYDSFSYNLVQAFGTLGQDVHVYKNDELTCEELFATGPTCIVISPGPCTPSEAGISLDVIETLHQKAQKGQVIPLLGVCLGHQALAQALGGKIILAPDAVHGKQSPIYHDHSPLFENCPQGFLAGRYHSLMVDPSSLSSDFIITAQTSNHLIMGIRHRYYPFYGLQFHPESILTPAGTHLLKSFLEITYGHHPPIPS